MKYLAVVGDDGETVRLEWRGNDPKWLTDFLEARAKRLDRAVKLVTSPFGRRVIATQSMMGRITHAAIIEAFNRTP